MRRWWPRSGRHVPKLSGNGREDKEETRGGMEYAAGRDLEKKMHIEFWKGMSA
jgi:hypothetical protein